MMPCQRPACPDWLAAHCEQWGAEYAAKLADNPRHRFAWKSWQGERVNLRLLPPLSDMTEGHCAYCDWFPMDTGTVPTIDHFRPKARFPELAYVWSNLYLACTQCQEKGNAFDAALIRPDELGYRFEHFFVYNYVDGTLGVNPAAAESDQRRVRITIDIFRLNARGRPVARQRELRRFRCLAREDRPDWIPISPFRYLLIEEAALMEDQY